MDGFPNGRRLEDDVTRIELQAVSGVALAAIGLWYDDYTAGGPNPVTTDLLDVLTYSTGVEANDVAFQSAFPYVAMPFSGTSECSGLAYSYTQPAILPPSDGSVGISEAAEVGNAMSAYPNPVDDVTTISLDMDAEGYVRLEVFNINGELLEVLNDGMLNAGKSEFTWDTGEAARGAYLVRATDEEGQLLHAIKLTKN